jgi:hypothetical protein
MISRAWSPVAASSPGTSGGITSRRVKVSTADVARMRSRTEHSAIVEREGIESRSGASRPHDGSGEQDSDGGDPGHWATPSAPDATSTAAEQAPTRPAAAAPMIALRLVLLQ